MKTLLLVFGLVLTIVSGSSLVNIRLPFINPAGVTYINGPAPTGLVAGPVPIQYSAQPQPQPQFQQLAYAPQPAFRAAPITFAQPALRAAPLLQPRVPAVADIPVTQIEAHHGVVQNLVDVAKPAIKTRKYEVRRPAIQKQFYDIEERVIVRPAGSALVELDQPISKNQKGLDVITPVHAVHPIHATPVVPVSGFVHQPVFVSSTPAPGNFQFENQQPSNQGQDQPQPQPPQDDDESVVVEARSRIQQQPLQPQQINQPLFRAAPQQQQQTQALFLQQPQPQLRQQQPQPQIRQQQPDISQRQQQSSELQHQQQIQFQELQQQQQNQLQQLQQRHAEEQQILEQQNENAQQQQESPQFRNQPQVQPENQLQQQQQPQPEQRRAPQPQVETHSNGEMPSFRFNQPSESDSLFVYSRQVTPEESNDNQQRLIQLLTARNSISEIGNGQSARSSNFINDAGLIRARVLSATPAPYNAAPTDERVNTRRVVLSRPIETIQEVVVQEPVTKLERVAVNTPTIFKTARLGVQRVHTSLPALPLLHHQQHQFAQTYHGIQK